MMATAIKSGLAKLADHSKAKILAGFFKTGKGQYGEGDKFLGVVVPLQRQIVKKYWRNANVEDIEQLLSSPYHEHRLVALLLLVKKYEHGTDAEKQSYFRIYLKNAHRINNWDLVDLSAPNIAGNWLLDKDRSVLYRLARSRNLWEKRIAILSSFAFIRARQFDDTFAIAQMLLSDKHDLIHKAAGWMLREVGKRDMAAEEKFLRKHYKKMPRTMLRYAIEKFPERKRRWYLK